MMNKMDDNKKMTTVDPTDELLAVDEKRVSTNGELNPTKFELISSNSTYKLGKGFRIEIVRKKNNIEAFLYHKNCSHKEYLHCCSIDDLTQALRENDAEGYPPEMLFVNMIQDELINGHCNYLAMYAEEHM